MFFHSNIPLRPSGMSQCKPMKPADFQLVEAQLLGTFEKHNSKPAGGMSGWSGPSYGKHHIQTRFLDFIDRFGRGRGFPENVGTFKQLVGDT